MQRVHEGPSTKSHVIVCKNDNTLHSSRAVTFSIGNYTSVQRAHQGPVAHRLRTPRGPSCEENSQFAQVRRVRKRTAHKIHRRVFRTLSVPSHKKKIVTKFPGFRSHLNTDRSRASILIKTANTNAIGATIDIRQSNNVINQERVYITVPQTQDAPNTSHKSSSHISTLLPSEHNCTSTHDSTKTPTSNVTTSTGAPRPYREIRSGVEFLCSECNAPSCHTMKP